MRRDSQVFLYSDYRRFLRDYYTSQKKLCKGFTLAVIAQRAGFASPSYIKNLMDGRRNVAEESIGKLAASLRLSKPESEYFRSMVLFNQTETLEEKLRFLAEMDRHRPKGAPHVLSSQEYRYLEKWYHPAIRELVDMPEFVESPDAIAGCFLSPMKPDEIVKALRFLEDEGFLVRDDAGKLTRKERTLAALPAEHGSVMSASIRRFHLAVLRLAENAVATMPVDQRSTGSTTLSLSPAGYESATRRIDQMRAELLEIANSDKSAERVYQLSVTLFPLTKAAVVPCSGAESGDA